MKNIHKINQNIYITNDEEIKEGDFATDGKNIIKWYKEYIGKTYKKIILTTDQDLINDGVQPIPDEFLEWFVKNPSCEKVKVEGHIYKGQDETEYKIIIPKEEPKQETLEEVADRLYPYEVGYGVFDRNCEIDIERQRFVEGAKWQQEQDKKLYSEEDMLNFADFKSSNIMKHSDEKGFYLGTKKVFNIWFEQNKKK